MAKTRRKNKRSERMEGDGSGLGRTETAAETAHARCREDLHLLQVELVKLQHHFNAARREPRRLQLRRQRRRPQLTTIVLDSESDSRPGFRRVREAPRLDSLYAWDVARPPWQGDAVDIIH